MNKSLVMSSCRSDGVLLRADCPATTLDAAWVASFDDGLARHAAATFTAIGGWRWSYVLAINLDLALDVPAAELWPSCGDGGHTHGRGGHDGTIDSSDSDGNTDGTRSNTDGNERVRARGIGSYVTANDTSAAGALVAWEHKMGVSIGPYLDLPPSGSLVLGACPQVHDMTPGWRYMVTAPVLPSQWVLLGELDKVVPVSKRRFSSVTSTASAPLTATVKVIVSETVSIAVLTPHERTTAVVTVCAAKRNKSAPQASNDDAEVVMVLTCSETSCHCQ